jgi:uncharacterized protein
MGGMDRRLFLTATAASAALVGAAQGQGTDAPNVALAKSLYAAFGKGEIPTIIAALAPEILWETVGRGSDFPTFGVRKGPVQVQEFFALVGSNLDFSDFSPREYYPVGDKVFVLGHYAMTVKKTGKKMESDWAHVFSVVGGKVTAFKEFLDTARAAEAYKA